MIALFSQASVCPDQMQLVLERRMQTAPHAEPTRTGQACKVGAAKRVFKVCDFPGPRPTARFPRGVRRAMVLFWRVRIPTFPEV